MSSSANHSQNLLFRKDINGLRALAVTGVVVFHIDPALLPGGFVGVDIFFVISGYLISRIILDQLRQGRFSLADFYLNRIKRIFPALLSMVFTVALAAWFLFDPLRYRGLGNHLEAGSYFALNFRLLREGGYFDLDSSEKPLLHLWSLSIEEQFYLLWPAILIALDNSRKTIPLGILCLFCASWLLCQVMTPIDPARAFYSPMSRAWELALGAALAYRESYGKGRVVGPHDRRADGAAVLGLLLMIGAMILFSEENPFPGWRAMVPTFGCALIVAQPHGAWNDRLLGNGLFQYVGLISYPLYLWHWPLLCFAHIFYGSDLPGFFMLALAIVAIGLATMTVYGVERPLSAFVAGRRWLAAAVLLAGLAFTGVWGCLAGATHGFSFRFPKAVAAVFDFQSTENDIGHSVLDRCTYDNPKRNLSLAEERVFVTEYYARLPCFDRFDPKKPTILIVGDSHARHLFAGISKTFGDDANVIGASATYCVPLVEAVRNNAGVAGTNRCHAFNDYVFQKIRAVKPDILIVGGYFDQLVRQGVWFYPGYVGDMVKGAKQLHRDGIRSILIAGQVPTWNPPLPELVGREMMAGQPPAEFSRVGLQDKSLATDAELSRQDWGEGVAYVSLAQKLCNRQGCRRLVGPKLPDDLIAFDYGHFSRNGSVFVADTILGPAIRAALLTASPAHADWAPR